MKIVKCKLKIAEPKAQAGDTLIEVIMGLVIMSTVLLAAATLTNRAFRQTVSARERTQSAQVMQEQAEGLRAFRDNSANWNAFKTQVEPIRANFHMEKAGGTWAAVTGNLTPVINGQPSFYTVSIAANFDPTVEKMTANVAINWQNLGGGPANSDNLATILVNSRIALGVTPPPPPPTPVLACNNGGDDDGDGKADFGGAAGLPPDPSCTDAFDNTESAEFPQRLEAENFDDLRNPPYTTLANQDVYSRADGAALSPAPSPRVGWFCCSIGWSIGSFSNVTSFNTIDVRLRADIWPLPNGYPIIGIYIDGDKIAYYGPVVNVPYAVGTVSVRQRVGGSATDVSGPVVSVPPGNHQISLIYFNDACCGGAGGGFNKNGSDRNVYFDYIDLIFP